MASGFDFFTDIPWEFALWSTLACFIVCWYLLYSSRSIGFLVELLVGLKLGKSFVFKVGSVNFALLGGKIYLHNVRLRSKNTSLHAVSIAVSFKWWRKDVRTPESPTGPCRLTLHATGVQYIIYCNSYAYDSLISTAASTLVEIADSNEEVALFYRVVPMTSVLLQDSAVVLGNPYLPSTLTVSVKLMEMLHYRANETKHTDVTLRSCRIFFQDNADYALAQHEQIDMIDIKRNLDEEDFLSSAIHGFQRFWDDMRQHVKKDSDQDEARLSFNHTQSDWLHQSHDLTLDGKPNISTESVPQISKASEAVNQHNVLRSDLLTVSYHTDVEGNMRVACKAYDAFEINYGPWEDLQRTQLYEHFIPFDYKHRTFDNLPESTLFLKVDFQDGIMYKIPLYEEGSSSKEFTITGQEDSSLSIDMPFVSHSSDGTATDIRLTLEKASFVPSTTGCSMIQCNHSTEIGAFLRYPVKWNDVHQWSFEICFNTPKTWILREHIVFINEIINKWMMVIPEVDLDHFIPTVYDFKFSLVESEILFHVNESNVFSSREEINNPETCPLISISSPDVTIGLDMSLVDYMPAVGSMQYSVCFSNNQFELSLPKYHPLSFLKQVRYQEYFMFSRKIRIDGCYFYNYRYHSDNIDMSTMSILFEDNNLNLEGQVVRYLGHWVSNYFGMNQGIATAEDFIANDFQNMEYRRLLTEYTNESENKVNAFETHFSLVFSPTLIKLPLSLSSTREEGGGRPLVYFHRAEIEYRSHSSYADQHVSFSPITVTVPTDPTPLSMRQSTAVIDESLLNTSIESVDNSIGETSYVRIQGFTAHLRSDYGPMPQYSTFRVRNSIHLESIVGQLDMGQISKLVVAMQNVKAQYIDSEDFGHIGIKRTATSENRDEVLFQLADSRGEFYLRHTSLSVVQDEVLAHLELPDGLSAYHSSLISDDYSNLFSLELPRVSVAFLTLANGYEWSEIGRIDAPVSMEIMHKRTDVEYAKKCQHDFIYREMEVYDDPAAVRARDVPWHENNAKQHNAQIPQLLKVLETWFGDDEEFLSAAEYAQDIDDCEGGSFYSISSSDDVVSWEELSSKQSLENWLHRVSFRENVALSGIYSELSISRCRYRYVPLLFAFHQNGFDYRKKLITDRRYTESDVRLEFGVWDKLEFDDEDIKSLANPTFSRSTRVACGQQIKMMLAADLVAHLRIVAPIWFNDHSSVEDVVDDMHRMMQAIHNTKGFKSVISMDEFAFHNVGTSVELLQSIGTTVTRSSLSIVSICMVTQISKMDFESKIQLKSISAALSLGAFDTSKEFLAASNVTLSWRVQKECEHMNVKIESVAMDIPEGHIVSIYRTATLWNTEIAGVVQDMKIRSSTVKKRYVSVLREAVHSGIVSPKSFKECALYIYAWIMNAHQDDMDVNADYDDIITAEKKRFSNFIFSDCLPFTVAVRLLLSTRVNIQKKQLPASRFKESGDPETVLIAKLKTIVSLSKIDLDIIKTVLMGLVERYRLRETHIWKAANKEQMVIQNEVSIGVLCVCVQNGATAQVKLKSLVLTSEFGQGANVPYRNMDVSIVETSVQAHLERLEQLASESRVALLHGDVQWVSGDNAEPEQDLNVALHCASSSFKFTTPSANLGILLEGISSLYMGAVVEEQSASFCTREIAFDVKPHDSVTTYRILSLSGLLFHEVMSLDGVDNLVVAVDHAHLDLFTQEKLYSCVQSVAKDVKHFLCMRGPAEVTPKSEEAVFKATIVLKKLEAIVYILGSSKIQYESHNCTAYVDRRGSVYRGCHVHFGKPHVMTFASFPQTLPTISIAVDLSVQPMRCTLALSKMKNEVDNGMFGLVSQALETFNSVSAKPRAPSSALTALKPVRVRCLFERCELTLMTLTRQSPIVAVDLAAFEVSVTLEYNSDGLYVQEGGIAIENVAVRMSRYVGDQRRSLGFVESSAHISFQSIKSGEVSIECDVSKCTVQVQTDAISASRFLLSIFQSSYEQMDKKGASLATPSSPSLTGLVRITVPCMTVSVAHNAQADGKMLSVTYMCGFDQISLKSSLSQTHMDFAMDRLSVSMSETGAAAAVVFLVQGVDVQLMEHLTQVEIDSLSVYLTQRCGVFFGVIPGMVDVVFPGHGKRQQQKHVVTVKVAGGQFEMLRTFAIEPISISMSSGALRSCTQISASLRRIDFDQSDIAFMKDLNEQYATVRQPKPTMQAADHESYIRFDLDLGSIILSRMPLQCQASIGDTLSMVSFTSAQETCTSVSLPTFRLICEAHKSTLFDFAMEKAIASVWAKGADQSTAILVGGCDTTVDVAMLIKSMGLLTAVTPQGSHNNSKGPGVHKHVNVVVRRFSLAAQCNAVEPYYTTANLGCSNLVHRMSSIGLQQFCQALFQLRVDFVPLNATRGLQGKITVKSVVPHLFRHDNLFICDVVADTPQCSIDNASRTLVRIHTPKEGATLESVPMLFRLESALVETTCEVDFGKHTIVTISSSSIPDLMTLFRSDETHVQETDTRTAPLSIPGSLIISFERLDLFLLKDASEKDVISIVGVDIQFIYEQFDKIQRLVLDIGRHPFVDDKFLSKDNPLGALYIGHLKAGETSARSLLEIPGFALQLLCDNVADDFVDMELVSFWDEDIGILDKLGYYRWIAEILNVYSHNILQALPAMMSTDDGPQKHFKVSKYVLRPNVSWISQITPARLVDTALGQLGLPEPRRDLPIAIRSSLVLPMAAVLSSLGQIQAKKQL